MTGKKKTRDTQCTRDKMLQKRSPTKKKRKREFFIKNEMKNG